MKIELIDWYGGDKAIARAAWCSTQIDVKAKSDAQIGDLLISKLWNNGSGKPHKTPFERGIVEFNITCDQASHIHLLKHRTANINGESARYKELKEDKTYLPEDWKGLDAKLDHLFYNENEFVQGFETWYQVLEGYTQLGNKLYHKSLEELTPHLGRKRAKESCRFFKTMNSEITLSVMMNMSCFYNFHKLRNDEAAQLEIRLIAQRMWEAIESIPKEPFKHTLAAFKAT